MRILNFKFMEKWCSDKVRELNWGIEHIKQWQPSSSSLIYKGDYNMLKGKLITALVISLPCTNANHFSLVNATINDTHLITTMQRGDELFTNIVTNNYTMLTNTGAGGEFIGETKTYTNGSKVVKGPYGNGKATRYMDKDSQDVKITYADEKDNIYRTEILYANDTFLVDFLNGTTISLDSEGTRRKTDFNESQTTYSNGTQVITTKIEPIQTITIHPDGTKITKFKKNGTVIEEDKYGGRIVKKDNNIAISYNDSRLNINANKWEIELGGDEDNHQEL